MSKTLKEYYRFLYRLKIRKKEECLTCFSPFEEMKKLNNIINRIKDKPSKKKCINAKNIIETEWDIDFLINMRRERYVALKKIVYNIILSRQVISIPNCEISCLDIVSSYGLTPYLSDVLEVYQENKLKDKNFEKIVETSFNLVDEIFEEYDSFMEDQLMTNCYFILNAD